MPWYTTLIGEIVIFEDVIVAKKQKDLKTEIFSLLLFGVLRQFRLKCLMEHTLNCKKPPFNKWKTIY
jgi:hypothetical protein